MSWAGFFQVVQGLYYVATGAHYLASWLNTDDADLAERQTAPPLKDDNVGFGLLGFQGGLHNSQLVDELQWMMRVPIECHIKRNLDAWKKLREEVEADGESTGSGVKVVSQKKLDVPKEVEFFLTVEWHHNHSQLIQRGSFRFVGKEDFVEVTIPQMAAENQNPGALVVLSDTSARATARSRKIPQGHPKYFELLTPPESVGYTSPLYLCWTRVSISPGPGLTLDKLARWFDPENPGAVKFTLDHTGATPQQQMIDFDL
jgi:hypothetical protein